MDDYSEGGGEPSSPASYLYSAVIFVLVGILFIFTSIWVWISTSTPFLAKIILPLFALLCIYASIARFRKFLNSISEDRDRETKWERIIDIHPKRVFDLVSLALFIAGFIILFPIVNLPDEILGLSRFNLGFLLIGSSILVGLSWRAVDWYNRRK